MGDQAHRPGPFGRLILVKHGVQDGFIIHQLSRRMPGPRSFGSAPVDQVGKSTTEITEHTEAQLGLSVISVVQTSGLTARDALQDPAPALAGMTELPHDRLLYQPSALAVGTRRAVG
jgi:hypothetical protein